MLHINNLLPILNNIEILDLIPIINNNGKCECILVKTSDSIDRNTFIPLDDNWYKCAVYYGTDPFVFYSSFQFTILKKEDGTIIYVSDLKVIEFPENNLKLILKEYANYSITSLTIDERLISVVFKLLSEFPVHVLPIDPELNISIPNLFLYPAINNSDPIYQCKQVINKFGLITSNYIFNYFRGSFSICRETFVKSSNIVVCEVTNKLITSEDLIGTVLEDMHVIRGTENSFKILQSLGEFNEVSYLSQKYLDNLLKIKENLNIINTPSNNEQSLILDKGIRFIKLDSNSLNSSLKTIYSKADKSYSNSYLYQNVNTAIVLNISDENSSPLLYLLYSKQDVIKSDTLIILTTSSVYEQTLQSCKNKYQTVYCSSDLNSDLVQTVFNLDILKRTALYSIAYLIARYSCDLNIENLADAFNSLPLENRLRESLIGIGTVRDIYRNNNQMPCNWAVQSHYNSFKQYLYLQYSEDIQQISNFIQENQYAV